MRIREIMKNYFSVLLFLLIGSSLFGQDQISRIPLTIGYLGNSLIEPGLQVGTEFKLQNWQNENETISKTRELLLIPQLGFFSRIGNNYNFMPSLDLAFRTQKNNKKAYHTYALGLAYQIESVVISTTVNLSNGDETKNRKTRNYFIPTINYQYGRQINSNLGWYTKFSYGWRFSNEMDNGAMVLLGLGLRFYLN